MTSKSAADHARAALAGDLPRILLLATLYFGLAQLGLTLNEYHRNVTLVWPPTGLSLATLILFGVRLWPGVFIGAFVTTLAIEVRWLPALGIATGNTLEAVVGALLLTRFVDFRPTLERLRDVAAFLLIGACGCTMVSATVGVVVLWLTGAVAPDQFPLVWLVWWLGDAAGAVIVAPFIFVLLRGSPSWDGLVRRVEFWLILAPATALSGWAFSGLATGHWARFAAFLPFPFLVWSGSRLGPRGAVTTSLVIMTVATLGTGAGHGPFVGVEPTHGSLLLWAYGMSMGSIAFTLAAVTSQRDLAERERAVEEAARIRAEGEQLLSLERERIMREMHDGLGGQLISAIAMVERGRGTPDEIAKSLRQALDDMRIAVDTLDPGSNDLRTALGKLRARLEPVVRRNDVHFTWVVEDLPMLDSFSAASSLNLLRIIQEAVTNAIRHARARRIFVKVFSEYRSGGEMSVQVEDDGEGFFVDSPSDGRGISHMRARAAELGGELRIEQLEHGTRVRLTVPVES